jgi:hypothetical protein
MKWAAAVAMAIGALVASPIAHADVRENAASLEGLQISAGAGVVDFTGAAASHLTEIGQLWQVCLLVGTDQFVAFEAAYTGTANKWNHVMMPFVSNTQVIGNSVEGSFRLQIPRWLSPAQPYGFFGAGWNNYWLTNPTLNPQAVMRADNMTLFNMGGGVQYYVTQHFIIDTRFTYRQMIGNNLLHTSASGQPGAGVQSMNQWAFSGQVGYAF